MNVLSILNVVVQLFGALQSVLADVHAAASTNDQTALEAIQGRLDAAADALSKPGV